MLPSRDALQDRLDRARWVTPEKRMHTGVATAVLLVAGLVRQPMWISGAFAARDGAGLRSVCQIAPLTMCDHAAEQDGD